MKKSKKLILGFAGRKRSGKSVLSKAVASYTPNKVVILSVATYLKDMCANLLGMTFEQMIEYKDNNKSIDVTVDDKWINILKKKTTVSHSYLENEVKGTKLKNVREVLQYIGTDVIRKFQPDWHLEQLMADIDSYSDDTVICIDDVRFPNEKKALEEIGAEIFFIMRPNALFNISNHDSEIAITWDMFDDNHVIINEFDEQTLIDTFRVAFVTDFAANRELSIFLSNLSIYKKDINHNFPKYDSSLVKEIVKQNFANPLFNKKGIIVFNAKNRMEAETFVECIYGNDCVSYRRNFLVYNPLIIENLKKFITL